MDLNPFQEKILKQLISQERMLSELYGYFAKQFPQYKKFWEKLSREEEQHARIVQKLFNAVKKEKVLFDEGKIKTYTLDVFITRLDGILQKAKNQEFTLSTAIACAVDYETSLIEKNIFSHFDSLNDKVRQTLKILQSETLKHIESIKRVQQAQKNI